MHDPFSRKSVCLPCHLGVGVHSGSAVVFSSKQLSCGIDGIDRVRCFSLPPAEYLSVRELDRRIIVNRQSFCSVLNDLALIAPSCCCPGAIIQLDVSSP